MTIVGAASPAARGRRWWRILLGRVDRSWVDAAVAVLIALSTVAVGALVDDAFPPGAPVRSPACWRIAAVVVSVVLLSGSVFLRSALVRARGTLFYVEMLPRGQRNLHTDAVRQASRSRLDFQQFAATLDPPTLSAGSFWEVSTDVERFARRLTDATNIDNSRTGTEIAPNLSWMCALGLGYRWRPPSGVIAVEVGAKPTELDIDKLVDAAHATASSLRAERLTAPPELVWSRSPEPSASVAVIHLSATIGIENLVDEPTSVSVAGRQVRGDRTVVVASVATGATVTLRFDDDGTADVNGGQVTTAGFANQIAAEIIRARVDHPLATILLRTRVPKVVAFGVGIALNEILNEYWREDVRDPRLELWERLVPLHWAETFGYVPTRILREQPDPMSLLSGVVGSPSP